MKSKTSMKWLASIITFLSLLAFWPVSTAHADTAVVATTVANEATKTFIEASFRGLSVADVLLLTMGGILVFFMQSGFALVEAGASRAKNAVNVMMKNYLDMCFGGIAFWLVGYGLMFGVNNTGYIGTDNFLFNPTKAGDYLFFFFQIMFCSTAATIVSGAAAERMKLSAYLVGSFIISALIYPVFGSWAWGGWHGGAGWLSKLGYIDFAGSSVVHLVGGSCALAAILVLKPRSGRFTRSGESIEIPGHNMSLVVLGTFILWFGWFGFNGSSIASSSTGTDSSLGKILVNTHLAAMMGVFGTMLAMKISKRKVRLSVVANGGLAGLVAITAGCQVMSPLYAMLTGFIGGLFYWWSAQWLDMMKIDDVVGAVPVHLINGVWGTLAAGMFNEAAFMSMKQITIQLLGIGAGFAWAFGLSFIMYIILNKTMGMRVDSIDEQRGLDFTEHDEIAYPEFQEVIHGKV